MKKIATAILILLNVTNLAFADCVTGYACSIKDLNKNNTNSVIKNENKSEKMENEIQKVDKKSINEEKDKKDVLNQQNGENKVINSTF